MSSRTLTALRNMFKDEVGSIDLDELKRRHETPESRYIPLQGMQVHYRDIPHENADAPVLIMLHGIFSSLHTWNDWSDILKQHFRVISIDSPNFGLTGAHPQGMHTYLYSDFLNEFTNALGLEKVMMAGNSLGGWMSWEFAARFPDKVEKIILLDSAGFFFIPPAVLLSMGLPFGGWLASRTVMPRKVLHGVVRTTYADKSKPTKEVLDRYYDMLVRPGNRQAAAGVLRYIRNKGGFKKSLLGKITQPVLIMWGKNDGWIPPEHAEKFKQAIPHAQVIMYDNCGHMPMEEIPQKSAADALKFLL